MQRLMISLVMTLLVMSQVSGGTIFRHQLFSEPKVLISPQSVEISAGNPHTVFLDVPAREYSDSVPPPIRVIAWDVKGSGIFTFAFFSNVSEEVHPFLSNYTEYQLKNVDNNGNGTLYTYLSDSGEQIFLMNITSDTIDPWVMYFPFDFQSMLQIYYDGVEQASLKIKVEESEEFAFAIPRKDVTLADGDHFSVIGEINGSKPLNFTAYNVTGQGTLRFFIFSDSSQEIYEDYSRYFDDFQEAEVLSRSDGIMVYSIGHDTYEELMIYREVPIDGSNPFISIVDFFAFVVGDERINGQRYPEPDMNPTKFSLAVYYEGLGLAKFTIEAKYSVTFSWVLELGKDMNGLVPFEQSDTRMASFPLFFSLITVAMGVFTYLRKRNF